jgi:hypothetical protein
MSASTIRAFAAAAAIALSTGSHAGIVSPPMDPIGYDALRTELISRIDTYAPGWTDYNTGDPGVTVLEALAFSLSDLYYRVAVDLGSLLWANYDPDDDESRGALAYAFFDAAWAARHGESAIYGDDWLIRNGIDPSWTHAQLIAAATAVPEPGPWALFGTGALLIVLLRARSSRRG